MGDGYGLRLVSSLAFGPFGGLVVSWTDFVAMHSFCALLLTWTAPVPLAGRYGSPSGNSCAPVEVPHAYTRALRAQTAPCCCHTFSHGSLQAAEQHEASCGPACPDGLLHSVAARLVVPINGTHEEQCHDNLLSMRLHNVFDAYASNASAVHPMTSPSLARPNILRWLHVAMRTCPWSVGTSGLPT